MICSRSHRHRPGDSLPMLFAPPVVSHIRFATCLLKNRDDFNSPFKDQI